MFAGMTGSFRHAKRSGRIKKAMKKMSKKYLQCRKEIPPWACLSYGIPYIFMEKTLKICLTLLEKYTIIHKLFHNNNPYS